MNKRHYEHTLPNIRGSLSNTYVQLQCYGDELVCNFLQIKLLADENLF